MSSCYKVIHLPEKSIPSLAYAARLAAKISSATGNTSALPAGHTLRHSEQNNTSPLDRALRILSP